jgi:hypothetical protein
MNQPQAYLMLKNNGQKMSRYSWSVGRFLYLDQVGNINIQREDGSNDIYLSLDGKINLFTNDDLNANDWNQC